MAVQLSALSVSVAVLVLVAAVVDAAPVVRERRDAIESIKWHQAVGLALCGVEVSSYELRGSRPTRSVEKVSCLAKDEGRQYSIGKHVYRCVAVQTTHKFSDGSSEESSIDVDSGCIAVKIPDQEVKPTASVTDQ